VVSAVQNRSPKNCLTAPWCRWFRVISRAASALSHAGDHYPQPADEAGRFGQLGRERAHYLPDLVGFLGGAGVDPGHAYRAGNLAAVTGSPDGVAPFERSDGIWLHDDLKAELLSHRLPVEVALDRPDLAVGDRDDVHARQRHRAPGRELPAQRPGVGAAHQPLNHHGAVRAGIRGLAAHNLKVQIRERGEQGAGVLGQRGAG
jgi:hypothetical protein